MFKLSNLSFFRKTPEKNFEDLSIKEILNKIKFNFVYPLDMSETQIALKKCSDLMDVATLYNSACFGNLMEVRFVDSELLKPILLEMTKRLSILFQERPNDLTIQLKQFSELHYSLRRVRSDKPNSEERDFLRKKIEAEWKKVAKEEFIRIKRKGLSDTGSYEILFHLCHPSDELRFEIADIINNMPA